MERRFRAWMADDGYHVEFTHPCDPPENNVRGTLPYPTWKAVDGRVVPSIHCQKCGLHEFVGIGEKPLLLQAVDAARGSIGTAVAQADDVSGGTEDLWPRTQAAQLFFQPMGFGYHSPGCGITAEDNCTCVLPYLILAVEREARGAA